MKVNKVLNKVLNNDGVRCKDIVHEFKLSQQSASGILSHLKKEGKITNKEGFWYRVKNNKNVQSIMNKLNDIGFNNMSWIEGYISGLADYEIIDEYEFDDLLILIYNRKKLRRSWMD